MPADRPPAPPVVDSASALAVALAELRLAPIVTFDTEFHGERSYWPKLMLLQVATPDTVWLFDPLSLDLREVVHELARPGRVVIGHALRNDLRILWQAYGARFECVHDTQIAAAFLGCGLQMGLGQLLQRTLKLHLPKGEQMADWSQRPLPDKLRVYAAGDVAHLLEVYDQQFETLQERGRADWVRQECIAICDPAQYDRDPATAGDRVTGARKLEPADAGVLYALAELREIMAQQEDLVPHFLVTDEALLALTKLKPRHAKDVHGDRRLQTRAIQRHAERWVQAVHAGLAKPLRRAPGRPPPPPELEAVAAAAMLLVGELANAESIAPQLLAKRDGLLDALRESPVDIEAFADLAGLHGWRRELVAPQLWQWLSGDLALRCAADAAGGWRLAVGAAA